MNNTIAYALTLTLALAALGCGGSDEPDAPDGAPAAQDAQAPDSQPDAKPKPTNDGRSTKAPDASDEADAPTAVAVPELLEYRVSPAPTRSVLVTVSCPVAGRLELLDGNRLLDSDTAEKPLAICRVARSESGATRVVRVRFEPADGSPGTQRICRIPTGASGIRLQLSPPTGDHTWQLAPAPAPTDG